MKATARLDTLITMLKGAAVSVALAAGAADAAPVTVQGLTFDDRMGGLVIHGASGRGTLDDPIVLIEDITEDGPAIVTINGMSAAFGNLVRTQHTVGFALTKVVRNLTNRAWEVFELELREKLAQSSPYEDGLSFGQDAMEPVLMASDRFLDAYKTDEPLDSLSFSHGRVEPGETVAIRMVVTDYSPTYEFFLLQRRNAPVAQLEPPATR